MVCRHIKLCRSFELWPLKGKGGVDFTAVGTNLRLCHKGNFLTKDKMAGPEVVPLKDPLHNSLQKILYNGLQYTIVTRGQPPYEGQNGCPQHALYSEVPLCCACFYIRLSIVTLRTWSPGLCLASTPGPLTFVFSWRAW